MNVPPAANRIGIIDEAQFVRTCPDCDRPIDFRRYGLTRVSAETTCPNCGGCGPSAAFENHVE